MFRLLFPSQHQPPHKKQPQKNRVRESSLPIIPRFSGRFNDLLHSTHSDEKPSWSSHSSSEHKLGEDMASSHFKGAQEHFPRLRERVLVKMAPSVIGNSRALFNPYATGSLRQATIVQYSHILMRLHIKPASTGGHIFGTPKMWPLSRV